MRFAESIPDFSQVIAPSGRYVSHGILFDTGNDRLRPESVAVIESIARGLEANPALKLLIEGHSDSEGSAGLGSTKPIDTNYSPQGRSQNRRVEFVKQ